MIQRYIDLVIFQVDSKNLSGVQWECVEECKVYYWGRNKRKVFGGANTSKLCISLKGGLANYLANSNKNQADSPTETKQATVHVKSAH